jgi:SAM-dependent methyltransferase
MTRERRLVFGEVADVYERVRPDYPDAVFDTVAVLGGLAAGDRVCEVGAGSGKATRSLVARGWTVTAVEPSEPMAAVLRAACPGVTVVARGFDEGDPPGAGFGAVVAAQAWHWITPVTRTARAAYVLRPGGVLAVWWNRPAARDDDLRTQLDEVYARVAPTLREGSNNRIPSPFDKVGRDAEARADTEIVASGRFGPVVRAEFPWSRWYDTADYLALLTTYSDHRLLDPATLDALLDGVAAVLDAHGGGVEHGYVTELVAAVRPSGAH